MISIMQAFPLNGVKHTLQDVILVKSRLAVFTRTTFAILCLRYKTLSRYIRLLYFFVLNSVFKNDGFTPSAERNAGSSFEVS